MVKVRTLEKKEGEGAIRQVNAITTEAMKEQLQADEETSDEQKKIEEVSYRFLII